MKRKIKLVLSADYIAELIGIKPNREQLAEISRRVQNTFIDRHFTLVLKSISKDVMKFW